MMKASYVIKGFLKINPKVYILGRSTKVTDKDPVVACVGDRTHHLMENLDPSRVSIFIDLILVPSRYNKNIVEAKLYVFGSFSHLHS